MAKIELITGKSRQKYDTEYKIEMVSKLKESGMNIKEFAKKNGIAKATLALWQREAKKGNLRAETALAVTTVAQSLTGDQTTHIAQLEASNEALRSKVKQLSDELYHCYAFIGVQQRKSQNLLDSLGAIT